jgi:hypothetical protein
MAPPFKDFNVIKNFDREWHTKWYQAILNKRYNYIYEDK